MGGVAMLTVRNKEQIQSILARIARPDFLDCEIICITFETTPEFVKTILPPPLEPAEKPLGTITISTWGNSNVAGAFRGASISLAAKYKDISASFCLTMPMNTDTAIIFGRETMGEPKKQAQIDVFHSLDKVIGTVARNYQEFMRVSAKPLQKIDPDGLKKFGNFHFKYAFAPDGSGLDADPKIVLAEFDNDLEELYLCEGDVQLTKSSHDLYGDVPITKIISTVYSPKLDMHAHASYIGETDKEAFLPYAFMKVDPYDNFSR